MVPKRSEQFPIFTGGAYVDPSCGSIVMLVHTNTPLKGVKNLPKKGTLSMKLNGEFPIFEFEEY